MTPIDDDVREWISFEDDNEQRTWMFDVHLLESHLVCIYGHGCQGVLDEPAPELAQGCCSYGAHFVDDDDVAHVVQAFVHLDASVMQFYDEAVDDGFLVAADTTRSDDASPAIDHARAGGDDAGAVRQDEPGTATRLVDDACIFLNRPGFEGGVGCALHLAAEAADRRPLDWKPNVCWQVPIRLEHFTDDNGHVVSRLRSWQRRDWGSGGEDFAWWCTEAAEAHQGPEPVFLSARDELIELVGADVYHRLVDALGRRRSDTRAGPPDSDGRAVASPVRRAVPSPPPPRP